MGNKKLRFGVVGCGDVANTSYLPLICEHGELVATCDSILERAKNSKDAWGGKAAYGDPQDLFARNDVDAVVISTVHDTHGSLTIAAAEAGKHVLVQKPMAVRMDEAHAVVEAVKNAGTKVVVEPAPQLRPTYEKARELLEQGAIGRPLYFVAEQAMGSPSYGSFYLQKKGGGPLYGIGIYAFSVLTYLFGPARRVIGAGVRSFESQKIVRPEIMTRSVSAAGYKQPWGGGPPKDMVVEQGACDNTFTILHFDHNFFGCVTANYVTFHGPVPRGLRIFGSEGAISIEAETPLSVALRDGSVRPVALSVDTGTGEPEEFSFDEAGGPENAIQVRSRNSLLHLIDCVQNDEESLPSVEWGRHLCEILIGSEESAEDGVARELQTVF